MIASADEDLCLAVQNALATGTFRVYANSDVYGVELGGALKNIYAIICGIAMALNVGQNAIATVITRSLAEMSRFAVSMGASPYTFLGLSGVGDLVATCTSPHSRNYQLTSPMSASSNSTCSSPRASGMYTFSSSRFRHTTRKVLTPSASLPRSFIASERDSPLPILYPNW